MQALDNQNFVHYARLINNFEGTYKSFKKVQETSKGQKRSKRDLKILRDT